MKAHTLLLKAKSVAERADTYATRIKTSLERTMLVPLQEKIDKIDDEIFDLENFALDTKLNKGMKMMTKEDCEARFESIINKKHAQTILQLELDNKQKEFDKLFKGSIPKAQYHVTYKNNT